MTDKELELKTKEVFEEFFEKLIPKDRKMIMWTGKEGVIAAHKTVHELEDNSEPFDEEHYRKILKEGAYQISGLGYVKIHGK